MAMSIHNLMSQWAKETYSSRNTHEQREIFSECLRQLRDLYQYYVYYQGIESPEKLPEVLSPSWKREIGFNMSVEGRAAYERCIEQLDDIAPVEEINA